MLFQSLQTQKGEKTRLRPGDSIFVDPKLGTITFRRKNSTLHVVDETGAESDCFSLETANQHAYEVEVFMRLISLATGFACVIHAKEVFGDEYILEEQRQALAG